MTTFAEYARQVGKLVQDNSPAIMTAIGMSGTVATAVLTGKASYKAADAIRDEQYRYDKFAPDTAYFGPKEKAKLVWKLYLPPAGVGLATVTAIFMANRIGSRRGAAMAAAYSLTERAFNEYQEKVVERFGDAKEQKIRDEIAQDRVNNNPNNREVIIVSGEVLCFDTYSSRYFKSDMETVRQAMNKINRQILHDGYASLGDFYEEIGLDKTDFSEEIGWNSDRMLELKFSTTLAKDDRPCITISFWVMPIRGYHKFH